ncbi:malate/lactate/ureidoglycolate dehydrogenase [Devosia sp.]|uniref:malate/lactate/ureidoglycolate dehydrogenase n=1 Tax=Devosia sp. TaxID=1871048 RepID=UPI001AFD72E0|nr:malate/lactate/ureidoglycolate dehydrogenase [Devosia sp.]MBO9589133.1 malate/lactate/ureidoglycolate dehydrogenase [Devosia sp.]
MVALPVEPELLRRAVVELFEVAGATAENARLIAGHLIEANLRGHDSHGVGVVPLYLKSISAGGMVLNQTLKPVVDSGGMVIFDAGRGVGQVMGHRAMEAGIELAQAQGSAIVGLRNSHHLGRIGHWAEQCAAAGLVSIHFVNVVAGPIVAPFGGTKARLGTNPFAAGFPRAGAEPVVVDFATSRLAMGKIRVYRNQGKKLPDNALLTADGLPTNNPDDLFAEPPGVLVPFGEHKGWGLALACELLGAALLGGETQHDGASDPAVINSMLSILVSPERIGTLDVFGSEMAQVLAWVQSENAEKPGQVLLPGQPEQAVRRQRMDEGIPIDPTTLGQIVEAASESGLKGLIFQNLAREL